MGGNGVQATIAVKEMARMTISRSTSVRVAGDMARPRSNEEPVCLPSGVRSAGYNALRRNKISGLSMARIQLAVCLGGKPLTLQIDVLL